MRIPANCLKSTPQTEDNYKKEAQVSTAGVRGIQNILFPWDTRYPLNMAGIALATYAKAKVALKIGGSRAELLNYLQDHPNVNSLYRTGSDYDVLAELVFRELRDVDEFMETLKKRFEVEKSLVLPITEDLKREEFMSKVSF